MASATKLVALLLLAACGLAVAFFTACAGRWVDCALGLVCFAASVGWLKESA